MLATCAFWICCLRILFFSDVMVKDRMALIPELFISADQEDRIRTDQSD